MKKLFIIPAVLLILTACDANYSEVSNEYKLPEELNDCKVFSLRNTHGSSHTVIRCPNSDTTTHKGGKHPKTVTVTED